MTRPRPHQVAALEAITSRLKTTDRVQIVMACGTGKTLVGRWLAEQRSAETTLVIVPSLALVAQTLQAWRSTTGWMFEALVICSDPTTAHGERELADNDGQGVPAPFWARHRARVTTSPRQAGRVLQGRPHGRPLVIFSTYHSAHVAAAAVRASEATLDLVIADEAHHLAGHPRREFRAVLDDTLPATTRLFMTATPVTADPAPPEAGWDDWSAPLSMADTSLFGPVVYRLDFAAAIDRGLLSDYEVLIYETPGQRAPDPVAALAAAAARGLTRVLSFHSRVARARAFAAVADGHVLPDGRRVVAAAVCGTDSAVKRARTLALLESADPNTLVVISSARCLAEGVDLPAVDGILFADPKRSDVDVIQAVGRALRHAPGKDRGLVLLPVCYDPELDEDTTLSTSSFAAVWRIVRSLRRLDDRLAQELATVRRRPSRRGRHDATRRVGAITFELPSVSDLDQLTARIVAATSPAWDGLFAALEDYTVEHGSCRPPTGHRLHEWCERQRVAHRKGMLLPERAAALRSLPGWTWDLDEQKWLEQWTLARTYATAGGGLDLSDPGQMDRPIPHPMPRRGITTVGRWCARQRALARSRDLEPQRRELLEQVPSWAWSAVAEEDQACVDLLGEYVAWKGEANPPAGYVEDDQPLGDWLDGVRRRRALGTLSQQMLDELAIRIPPSSSPGALQWRRAESCWSAGLAALRQYQVREGRCRPPERHVEHLQEGPVNLHPWVRLQRHQHRHGRLDPARVQRLEEVPGWAWEVASAPRVRMDIGDARHGSRTGYVKGCRCSPCTEANRLAVPSGESIHVPAARARGHLRVLEGQGASQKAMARAAGLNTKTVAELLAGARDRIHPATERAILRLRISDVRRAAAGGDLIPAGPSLALVDDLLARGWPKTWILRELSTGTLPFQLRRTALVRAATAANIAALHRRVAGLTPPRRHPGQVYPSLAEILSVGAESA